MKKKINDQDLENINGGGSIAINAENTFNENAATAELPFLTNLDEDAHLPLSSNEYHTNDNTVLKPLKTRLESFFGYKGNKFKNSGTISDLKNNDKKGFTK